MTTEEEENYRTLGRNYGGAFASWTQREREREQIQAEGNRRLEAERQRQREREDSQDPGDPMAGANVDFP